VIFCKNNFYVVKENNISFILRPTCYRKLRDSSKWVSEMLHSLHTRSKEQNYSFQMVEAF